MKFALVNDERIEARSELKGQCPGCRQDVIAKCGTQRIWHWAHRAEKTCDPWREPETDWHRNWKNKFPVEWQECRLQEQPSGEWHIADVRTSFGLVIEFQHSHLDPQERMKRESFYQNMVWIVNGTRLKRDYPRFLEGISRCGSIKLGQPFLVADPEECFSANWVNSSVPVILDFCSIDSDDPSDRTREVLWWLLPGRVGGKAVVQAMTRKDFVEVASRRINLLHEYHRVVNDFEVRMRRPQRTVRVDRELLRLMGQQHSRRPRRRKSRRL